MRLVTHLRLCHATSSKMMIETITLFCIPMLLQRSHIIQNRVLYMEIWSMEAVGPQKLNTTHTAMKTHQEAHQHVEHSP